MKYDKVIRIRVSKKMFKDITNKAKQEKLNVSDFIRKLIKKSLSKWW